MSTRVAGLTGVTLQDAPQICHECIWWQSSAGRSVDKSRWIERAELDWGAWGAVYRDDDGTVIGSMIKILSSSASSLPILRRT